MNHGRKEDDIIETQIRGTTLKVYWWILRSEKSISVRGLQRAIGFSSPSTALHHLEKLREMRIIEKDEYGRYILIDEVKVGILRMFLRFGRLVLPRYLFYATFFTFALLFYIFRTLSIGNDLNIMIVLFGASASLVSIYETVRLWREKFF